MAPVVQDDVLVEIAQVHHRRNSSWAALIAATSASTSASSL
jgi:hypothetical protein